MLYESIDVLSVAVADLAAAVAAYERPGLRLSPLGHRGIAGACFRIGKPHNSVTTELLADRGDGTVPYPLREPVGRARAAGRGLFAVALRVRDLSANLRQLASRGVEAVRGQVQALDGTPVADLGWLPLADRAGTDLVLIQHLRPQTDPDAPAATASETGQRFPLKRLDHLAAVAHDLDAKTRFWVDGLDVPQVGEVTTPTMVIRQFRIGDAILELLGPASPDSPLHQRAPGLVSMASWQVDDLDVAVGRARTAGFHPSDPATGVLPGTRTATIPAPELAGVAMQLLAYV
jgi:catechol 2,3-dioxygenase-like lactoylglutathione lyase family enzyme